MNKVEFRTSNTNDFQSSRGNSRGAIVRAIIILSILTVIAVGVLFFIKMVVKKEIVIIPGKISYSDQVSESEKSFIENSLKDISLSNDVTFSVKDSTESITEPNTVLYDIYLPVTGIYNAVSDITADKFTTLELTTSKTITYESEEYALMSIQDLSSEVKLLSVDNNYYLEDFSAGAKYHYLTFETSTPDEIINANNGAISKNITINQDNTLSINQTGVTALSRAMQIKLNKIGGDGAYFAANIKDFLSKSDYTHISNEISFADNCQVDSGSVVLCADPRMISSIDAIGTDIIELTGNHNNDWSASANLSTLSLYAEKGYLTFGGGKNEEIAKQPLELSKKENNITWIGFNLSTSTKANGQGAVGDHPGANIYDEDTIRTQITAAKEKGNFIIVDIQYFECYCYPDGYVEMPACDTPDWGYDQRGFFKSIVDMGADMIVGTSAHQPQTFEMYNNTPIYYGLGNLFFDQTYWPGTERGIILSHYFVNNKLIQTRVTPTVYHSELQVRRMTEEESSSYLSRLSQAR